MLGAVSSLLVVLSVLAVMAVQELSEIYRDLDRAGKTRYAEKLAFIGSDQDPYVTSRSLTPGATPDFPSVEYPDLYHYLVNAPSPCTKEEMKAYKSLEGYQFFVAGWVGNVVTFPATADGKRAFVMAKVRHSQSVSSAELQPWVAADMDGSVLCAHCTCMAGLGEACSHIAALLFTLVARTDFVKENSACTSTQCQWIAPSLQPVQYARICEMDFAAPSSKRTKPAAASVEVTTQLPTYTVPTTSEVNEFFSGLASTQSKPGILSIVPGFCERYVPTRPAGFPAYITDLYDEAMLDASLDVLLNRCDDVLKGMGVTAAESAAVEKATRDQSKSKLWFRFRAGRVTASKFRDAAHTPPANPSSSLIRAICYPDAYQFSSAATTWGLEHEQTARDCYVKLFEPNHCDFKVTDSGFVISTTHPYLGASPDGNINCTCCGYGVLEVKCPFKAVNKSFHDLAKDTNFCLKEVDGKFHLRLGHKYAYQVQAQMFVCKAAYSDFVVWSVRECVVIRVHPDPDFHKTVQAITSFYKAGVLPEIVGKYFTKSFKSTAANSDGAVCTCNEDKDGDVVECSHPDCRVKTFHLVCLRMKQKPKRKWICAACKKKE